LCRVAQIFAKSIFAYRYWFPDPGTRGVFAAFAKKLGAA
jgi:hypothetical protein